MAEDNPLFRKIVHGITIEWQIKDFSTAAAANGERITSPTFRESNAEWQMDVYPNGSDEESIGNVSWYLTKLSATDHFLVSAAVVMKVKNLVVGTEYIEDNYEHHYSWGFPMFVERSKILKYLKPLEDCVTFICTVCNLQAYRLENLPNNMLLQDVNVKIITDQFNELFTSHKLSDVIFKVGAKDYPAHKAILAARSPVFSSMFEHKMKENISGVVDISDCDPDCLEKFLKFLYSGNFEYKDIEQIVGIYKLADKYCVSELKEKCCTLMSMGLAVETISDVLDLATTYDETELLKMAIDFFIINATDILVTEKWQKFNVENTSVANNILKEMAMRSVILFKQKKDEE